MKDNLLSTHSRGVNSTRIALVQVIKLATKVEIHQEAKQYFTVFDNWVKAEGKRSALLRAKAIYHVALNWFLDQDPPEYPYLKTTRGFPTVCLYFCKYKHSPEGIQAVLSILGFYRGIRAPGRPELDSITNPSTVEPSSISKAILGFFPMKWKRSLDKLSTIKHLFRSRQGPNGQSLPTCLLDLVALKKESNLIDSILKLCDVTESEDFGDDLSEYLTWELPCDNNYQTSRLAVKQELGGKDRIFAMVDYFSQCTLKPLHSLVAEILKSINQDATWNQDKGAKQVQEWTRETIPLFSYDLKSATDRFPAILLRGLVEKIVQSKDYADKWLDLMTNRTFKFRSTTGIKYSVGQPMGAYSSWPVFALAHHLTVIAAAKVVKINNPEYVILGDDIVIRSEALAKSYLNMMKRLGVEISMQKSVTGLKVAEFAKRLFFQGREISAIPVKLISSSLRDFRLTMTLYEYLVDRTSLTKSGEEVPLFHDFEKYLRSFLNGPRLLKALDLLDWKRITSLSERTDGGPLTQSEVTSFKFLIRYKYLSEQYQVQMRDGSLQKESLDLIEFPGNSTEDPSLHPVYKSLALRIAETKRIHRDLGRTWTSVASKGFNVELPDVILPDFRELNPGYQRRIKQQATVLLEIYNTVKQYIDYKVTHPDVTVLKFVKLKSAVKSFDI